MIVDCHVLHCYEPPEWIDACLNSLRDEPANVHLCEGIPGKLGLARARAFAIGTAPYVSWVDGDDEIVAGAFSEALVILTADPNIVSTYCNIQLIGRPEGEGYIKGPWSPKRQLLDVSEVHHLHVMRRTAVEACLAELERWDGCEEYVLMGLLARYGRHHRIPKRLYRFRQHANYRRAGSIGGPPLFKKAVKRVLPILMDLHRRGIRQTA